MACLRALRLKLGIASVAGVGLVGGYGKVLRFMELLEGVFLDQLITNPSLNRWCWVGYLLVAGFALAFCIRVTAFALGLAGALPDLLWVAFNLSISARNGLASPNW